MPRKIVYMEPCSPLKKFRSIIEVYFIMITDSTSIFDRHFIKSKFDDYLYNLYDISNLTFVLFQKLLYHSNPFNWTICESWIYKHDIMVWSVVNHDTFTDFDKNSKQDHYSSYGTYQYACYWIFWMPRCRFVMSICNVGMSYEILISTIDLHV